MTICIAAIADCGRTVMTASDRMYSWGNETTGDGRIKTQRIHQKYWSVMIAGEDVRLLEPIIRQAQQELRSSDHPTAEQVKDVLRSAWRDQQRAVIEATVLSPFGYDRPTFLSTGRQQLGEVKFAELVADMQIQSELRCDLLVYGFDEHDDARLLTVSGRGDVSDCTRLGFMAIGSGARAAIDALLFTQYQAATGWRRALYCLCHAKFMSERALGVGKKTFVIGIGNDARYALWIDAQIKAIREHWKEHVMPTIPEDAEVCVPEVQWDDAPVLEERRSIRKSGGVE